MKETCGGIDRLDKQILQQMSKGINSYDDLAKICNVTRSTIYRRVTLLEEKGFIRRITRSVVDYEKLGLVMICFAFKINQSNQKRAFTALKDNRRVKLLWRTFGDYNAIFVAFCDKGEEGETIGELKTILEKYSATEINTSVGFIWEKTDFSPFSDEVYSEKQLKLYYSEDENLQTSSSVSDSSIY